MPMNDYEAALERFERISRSIIQIIDDAQAVIDWVNAEYCNAQDNLRQYESQPGVPLPQYRKQVTA